METQKSSTHMELLSGDEAVASGAWEAGLRVACAYPGTPSTEILETLAGFDDVDAQWSVNEKVAFEVALGSAIAGGRSLYASKHVGLNVAMDPLMTASYTGVNAGFVAVVCDDPGLASSQNEQDTRWVGIVREAPAYRARKPGRSISVYQGSVCNKRTVRHAGAFPHDHARGAHEGKRGGGPAGRSALSAICPPTFPST